MTDNQIVAEIEARLEGITPGEWDTQHNETSIDIHCKENYALIASIPVLADNAEDNATFIAHAPADIRFLLSALKEAQGENERLRANNDGLGGIVNRFVRAYDLGRTDDSETFEWIMHPERFTMHETYGYLVRIPEALPPAPKGDNA